MIELVGITGKARHGKDTVTSMILEELQGFTRFAFADKMKELAHAVLSASKAPEDEWKEGFQTFILDMNLLRDILGQWERNGIIMAPNAVEGLIQALALKAEDVQQDTPGYLSIWTSWRVIYQTIGTEWGREQQGKDFWLQFLPIDKPIIVSDVRGITSESYEDTNNEALYVKSLGGIVVEVVDPRKGSVVAQHCSEGGIDHELISYTIVNDGTLEDLHRKVMDFIYIWLMSDL